VKAAGGRATSGPVIDHAHAVILAGGSGTRFWPASRKARPKQLLPLGPGDAPLIAATVDRIRPLVGDERIVIATGRDLVAATRASLPTLPESAFLGEPRARNTAACIGWATAIVHRRDPEALVMVLPSDHHVADVAAFQRVVRIALDAARGGAIVTVGIEPTRPETGYGYIELGDEVSAGVRRGVSFREKPDRPTAEGYVSSGRYVWNAGMFFFRASRMLEEIERHLPELASGVARIEAAARRGAAEEAAETVRVFETVPSVSIDVGVMEKVENLQVVPASVGWTDIGSWESAWELGVKDAAGNATHGQAVAVDATNNLFYDLTGDGKGRLVAALGVHDLFVVQTDDAILVVPRDRSQDVRAIVAELEKRNLKDKL
jgi:mannose-1-phosphate guanylyltransferase